MSSLPSNWVVAPLGDLLTEVLGGGTPDKSKAENFRGDIPFMTVKDMHSRFIDDTQDHISKEALESSASRLIPADTLVIASRMSLGKIARPTRAVAINQDLKALFLKQGVSKPYIEYAWRANAARIQAMGTGTTVKGIRLEDIRGLQVPVAPVAEQTRIADQLDTLLTRIQTCQDRLEAIPALLKRFRQAVLGAATNGSLTADWRENREASAWVPTTIGDLLDGKPRNGYSPKSVDYETSVRSLTLSATTSGRFLSQHTKFIDESVPADSHLWLEPGDILVQRANTLEYVGVSAIFDGPPKSFIYPDLMMKCRPNNRVEDRFLYFLLSAEPTRRYFRDHATGTAGNMPKINQQTVMSAPVDLPPMDEQLEIVRRANRLLQASSQLEQRHTVVAARTRRLATLTLAKAFRGELVPQDPSDEPAAELLRRLSDKPPAARRGSRARANTP